MVKMCVFSSQIDVSSLYYIIIPFILLFCFVFGIWYQQNLFTIMHSFTIMFSLCVYFKNTIRPWISWGVSGEERTGSVNVFKVYFLCRLFMMLFKCVEIYAVQERSWLFAMAGSRSPHDFARFLFSWPSLQRICSHKKRTFWFSNIWKHWVITCLFISRTLIPEIDSHKIRPKPSS